MGALAVELGAAVGGPEFAPPLVNGDALRRDDPTAASPVAELDARLSGTALLIDAAATARGGETAADEVAGRVDGVTMVVWLGRFVSLRGGGTFVDREPVVPGIVVVGPRSAAAGCWFWRWMRLWGVGGCGASAADRLAAMHKPAKASAAACRTRGER